MSLPELIQVAPEGDVALVCGGQNGTNVVRIIVSSTFLTNGSSVFKTMLGLHFREGTTLATRSTVEIPLPDDDPRAMVAMCRVLHMRAAVNERHTPTEVLEVAKLVDKYDCTFAVGATAYVWLHRYAGQSDATIRAQMFTAAWLFRQQDLFALFGRELILKSRGPSFCISGDLPAPVAAIAAIEKQRQVLADHVSDFIAARVEDLSDTYYMTNCAAHCQAVSVKFALFTRQVTKSPIWPLNKILHKATVEDAIEALRAFEVESQDEISTCDGDDEYRGRCGALRGQSLQAMQQWVRSEAERVEQMVLQLCISCVEKGHVQDEGSCNAGHV